VTPRAYYSENDPVACAVLKEAIDLNIIAPGYVDSRSIKDVHESTGYALRSFWSDAEWIACADGKARRAKPGLRMLVDGMAGRTDLWRLAGNSINPVLAAEVIKALKDTLSL
jgi:hypothetical protein